MSLTQMFMLSISLVLTSGCMTLHDQKIAGIKLKDECNFEQGALFYNSPYYLSDGKTNAPIGNLSRLFGVYDKSIDLVRITKDGNYLSAKFYNIANKEIINRRPSPGKEYESDGKRFVINKWSSCKPGEAAVGCTWSHVELSCTEENDLAVKEVNGGAGMIALVVPIVTSSSFLGLYKHMPDITSNDASQPIAPGDTPQAARP